MQTKSPRFLSFSLAPFAVVLVVLAFTSALVEAVPLTLTLDNPNQVVAPPSSGITTLDYTGTINLDPGYKLGSATVFNPFNSSGTLSLNATFAAPFLTFFTVGTGSFSGSLFSIAVPTGTPPDLYAYRSPLFTSPSTFSLSAFNTETQDQVGASQAFSVLVTNDGRAVPDNGKTVLLFAVSAAGLYLFGRAVGAPEHVAQSFGRKTMPWAKIAKLRYASR